MVELLSRDFEDSQRHRETQNPIATTWLISFHQIEDSNSLAADYLNFMCFLSEKAIPRSLLPADAWTLEAEDAIGTLKAYASSRKEMRRTNMIVIGWVDSQC